MATNWGLLLTIKKCAQTVTKIIKSLRPLGTDETFHVEREGELRGVTLYFVRELNYNKDVNNG